MADNKATNYNISTEYEKGNEEKGVWSTIKEYAGMAWDYVKNDLTKDLFGDKNDRIQKASDAQDRIDELNAQIMSNNLSNDQIGSANKEIDRLTKKRDDYLSGKDASWYEIIDRASLRLDPIDEKDIFEVVNKDTDSYNNLSSNYQANKIDELKNGSKSLSSFLVNAKYDKKNEDDYLMFEKIKNGDRDVLKETKEGTGFGGFMQDTIVDIYKNIKPKDISITDDSTGEKVFYMAEEANMLVQKFLTDDIQDALQNNYNYIKKYESYLNSDDDAKVRTANMKKNISNYEAAIDNVERIKDGIEFMYDNYEKYNGDMGKLQYAYMNDRGYKMFSSSDKMDLTISDVYSFGNKDDDSPFSSKLTSKLTEPYRKAVADAYDKIGEFGEGRNKWDLTAEDFGILATNALALQENVNEREDAIAGKYGGDSLYHAARSLLSPIGEGSILSNTIETVFGYATAYIQDIWDGVWENADAIYQYSCDKLGLSSSPIGEGMSLIDYYNYGKAQQMGMTSLDIIKDQVTNNDSWTASIASTATQVFDAVPDIGLNLLALEASESAIARVFPSSSKVLSNPAKYISNLTKSKNGLTYFKNYDAAMSKLNAKQFLKVKIGEFAARSTAQNYVLSSVAQGQISEDYNNTDFFLDVAFSVFDLYDVSKSYKSVLPKLKQNFRNYFWEDYFIKNGLMIGDEDYLRLMRQDPNAVKDVANNLRESFNKGLDEYAKSKGMTSDEAFTQYYQLYKDSKNQIGYASAMSNWNKATNKMNTDILARAVKNDDKISQSIKNKIVKEEIKYADGTVGYTYKFKEKLTQGEFEELSKVAREGNEKSKGGTTTIYSSNVDKQNVTSYSYKESESLTNAQKEDRAYDILGAYTSQAQTGFLMNVFRRWEYDNFADKSKHLFGDVEYSWIGADDPEAVFRERVKQFANDYDKFQAAVEEEAKQGADSRFYGRHTMKEAKEYEEMTGKKNLVNIGLEEAKKSNPNLVTVSNEFYKTLCKDRRLSLFEKNEILYNVLDTEKESLMSFTKEGKKMFGSEFEKIYYVGKQAINLKGDSMTVGKVKVSKGGNAIGEYNYYINPVTGIINGEEVVYETIIILDNEGEKFAQINMVNGGMQLADKYKATADLDYHFEINHFDQIYSGKIYNKAEEASEKIDLTKKNNPSLIVNIGNILSDGIKRGKNTYGKGVTSTDIDGFLAKTMSGGIDEPLLQAYMKFSGFYKLPKQLQTVPFSLFLQVKKRIIQGNLSAKEGAEYILRGALSGIQEGTDFFRLTPNTSIKSDYVKDFLFDFNSPAFEHKTKMLAVSNSILGKEGTGRTLVTFERVEGHSGLLELKDLNGEHIGTMGINIGNGQKKDTGHIFFEIGGEIKGIGRGDDVLVLKSGDGDLEGITNKLTKKERRQLFIEKSTGNETGEFKSVLRGASTKDTYFSNSLKVSKENKRNVEIITALKNLSVKAELSGNGRATHNMVFEFIGEELGRIISSKFGSNKTTGAYGILQKHLNEGSLNEVEGFYIQHEGETLLKINPEYSLGYKMNYDPDIDTLFFAVEQKSGGYRTISIPKVGGLRTATIDGIDYVAFKNFYVQLDRGINQVQDNFKINLFKLDSDKLSKLKDLTKTTNETVNGLEELKRRVSPYVDEEVDSKLDDVIDELDNYEKELDQMPDEPKIEDNPKLEDNPDLNENNLNENDFNEDDLNKLTNKETPTSTEVDKETLRKQAEQKALDDALGIYKQYLSSKPFGDIILKQLSFNTVEDCERALSMLDQISAMVKDVSDEYKGNISNDMIEQYLTYALMPSVNIPEDIAILNLFGANSSGRITLENVDLIKERLVSMIELGSGKNKLKLTGRVYGYMETKIRNYRLQNLYDAIRNGTISGYEDISKMFNSIVNKFYTFDKIRRDYYASVKEGAGKKSAFKLNYTEGDYKLLVNKVDFVKNIIDYQKSKKFVGNMLSEDEIDYIREFAGSDISELSIDTLSALSNNNGHKLNDVVYTLMNLDYIYVKEDGENVAKPFTEEMKKDLLKNINEFYLFNRDGFIKVVDDIDGVSKVNPEKQIEQTRPTDANPDTKGPTENVNNKEVAEKQGQEVEGPETEKATEVEEQVDEKLPSLGDLGNQTIEGFKELGKDLDANVLDRINAIMLEDVTSRMKGKDLIDPKTGKLKAISSLNKILSGIGSVRRELSGPNIPSGMVELFDKYVGAVYKNLNSRGIYVIDGINSLHDALANRNFFDITYKITEVPGISDELDSFVLKDNITTLVSKPAVYNNGSIVKGKLTITLPVGAKNGNTVKQDIIGNVINGTKPSKYSPNIAGLKYSGEEDEVWNDLVKGLGLDPEFDYKNVSNDPSIIKSSSVPSKKAIPTYEEVKKAISDVIDEVSKDVEKSTSSTKEIVDNAKNEVEGNVQYRDAFIKKGYSISCLEGGDKLYKTSEKEIKDSEFINNLRNAFSKKGLKSLDKLWFGKQDGVYEILNDIKKGGIHSFTGNAYNLLINSIYLGVDIPKELEPILIKLTGTNEYSIKNMTNNDLLDKLIKSGQNTFYLHDPASLDGANIFVRGLPKYEKSHTLYDIFGKGDNELLNLIKKKDPSIKEYGRFDPKFFIDGSDLKKMYSTYLNNCRKLGIPYSGYPLDSHMKATKISRMGPLTSYEFFVLSKSGPDQINSIVSNPKRFYDTKNVKNTRGELTQLREALDNFYSAIGDKRFLKEYLQSLDNTYTYIGYDQLIQSSPYVYGKKYSYNLDKEYKVFASDFAIINGNIAKEVAKEDKVIIKGIDDAQGLIDSALLLKKKGYDIADDRLYGEIKATKKGEQVVGDASQQTETLMKNADSNIADNGVCLLKHNM